MNLQRMVTSAVGTVIVISILLVPMHDVEQTETYFTREPLTYEETFVRANQVRPFCFPWFCDKIQVQYGIKNTDNGVGVFTVTFAFDNGTDRGTENVSVEVQAGAEMTISQNSPLRGISEYSVDVTPPSKLVSHQRTVTKRVNTLSQLSELRRVLR